LPDTHQLVDHLFRQQAGQMVAWLTRVFGPAHLELAEEVVQDALVKALQQWPYGGIPDNPAGWLFQVARNGALDILRRNAAFRDRVPEIARELQDRDVTTTAVPPGIQDDELRMVFMCCHPELPQDSRVALSLKTVGGFSTSEIARAFLTTESTVAQRIVRAKKTLRAKRIPFELPSGSTITERLDSVLEVIYLLFNEGYAAHGGEALVRLDLCREALRLGRIVAASHVGGPAADALVALMAFQGSRIPARINERGEMVLLEEQDRTLWDGALVGLGFHSLARSATGDRMTPYHVQAAIAAVHAAAARAEDTDWPRILALYDQLIELNPSPIVHLNRAVALARVAAPAAALAIVARLEEEPALAGYYLLPSVKGTLLLESGDRSGAATAFREALRRPCSDPEKQFLIGRLERCG
jgi:RNA polymerase sigma-70 factor, ECF subfamily